MVKIYKYFIPTRFILKILRNTMWKFSTCNLLYRINKKECTFVFGMEQNKKRGFISPFSLLLEKFLSYFDTGESHESKSQKTGNNQCDGSPLHGFG